MLISKKVKKASIALFAAMLATSAAVEAKDNRSISSRFKVIDLPVSTQGPLWPPSEFVTEDGDFILLGVQLDKAEGEAQASPAFGAASLISKNSKPPMDENGNKINNNWFLAGHEEIRQLDLSKGSADLDMVLHTLSIGPSPEAGIPRIPREGDSAYNLYTDFYPCKDVFPTFGQELAYSRPSYPLHEVPILGFQGDQVAYDPETGASFTPFAKANPGFGPASEGEDNLDERPIKEPITLGQWLSARGKLAIALKDYDDEAQAYTSADFHFLIRGAIPNAVYTIWTIRPRRLPGAEFTPQADPLAIPNVIITNDRGNAYMKFNVTNPFPDPETDLTGERIAGLVVAFHADYQNWGACGGRLGAGVDIQTHFNTVSNGNLNLTDFITVDPK